MAFTRSAPSDADQESFPCSSAHDSHDEGANDNSYDVTAGRSLQAASDAASVSSLLSSGRSPRTSSAQQLTQDLVHLQCWGAGFAGGSGFVHACVHACVCLCVCASQLVESRCSAALCQKTLDSCLLSHLDAHFTCHRPSQQAIHLHLNSCKQLVLCLY